MFAAIRCVHGEQISSLLEVSAAHHPPRASASHNSPNYSDLNELVLAYACSIHKSQGSEYPCVVIPVQTQHYVMLQRNLLYTAITRGKRLVVLVGSKRALARISMSVA